MIMRKCEIQERIESHPSWKKESVCLHADLCFEKSLNNLDIKETSYLLEILLERQKERKDKNGAVKKKRNDISLRETLSWCSWKSDFKASVDKKNSGC